MSGRRHPYARKWFLSRKFIGVVVIFWTATAAMWLGKIDGMAWATVVGIVMTAFIGGEVAQKHVTGGGE